MNEKDKFTEEKLIYYPAQDERVNIAVLNNNTKILDEKKLEKSDLSDVAKESTSQTILKNINSVDSVITESLNGVAKEATSKQILSSVGNIGGVVDNSLKEYLPKSYLTKIIESTIEKKSFESNSISAGATRTICTMTANSNQELLTPLIERINLTQGNTQNYTNVQIQMEFVCEDKTKIFKLEHAGGNIIGVFSEEVFLYTAPLFYKYNSSSDRNQQLSLQYFDENGNYKQMTFNLFRNNNYILREGVVGKLRGDYPFYDNGGVMLPAMKKIKKFTLKITNNSSATADAKANICFMVRNEE